MPRRLISRSRSEPARTILFVVSVLTLLFQSLVLTPWVSETPWLQIPNVLFIGSFCVWGIWATDTRNLKHMSLSSFWLSMVWFWTGVTRLAFSPDPALLLWAPFIVVSATLGVCYVNLNHQKRLVT